MALRLPLAFVGSTLFALCGTAHAYEVKGISPGADLSTIDLKPCQAVPNADSGIPGYRCDTTYGGAPAIMTLVVANQKIVAVKILVKDQVMAPVLNALQEKYGRAEQPNRYIQSYRWKSGPSYLEIEEISLVHGYSVISLDFDLFHAVNAQQTQKAKGDI